MTARDQLETVVQDMKSEGLASHTCAYCGGKFCRLEAVEISGLGEYVRARIYCPDCSGRDAPVVEARTLLPIFQFVG